MMIWERHSTIEILYTIARVLSLEVCKMDKDEPSSYMVIISDLSITEYNVAASPECVIA